MFTYTSVRKQIYHTKGENRMKNLILIMVASLLIMSCGKDKSEEDLKKMIASDKVEFDQKAIEETAAMGRAGQAAEDERAIYLVKKEAKEAVSITTTFKDMTVGWHIFRNQVHTNGYVIIDVITTAEGSIIYNGADMDIVGKDFLTVEFQAYTPDNPITYKDKPEIFNRAWAAVIVSYKNKLFDVSTKANEVEATYQNIAKHIHGKAAINKIEKW